MLYRQILFHFRKNRFIVAQLFGPDGKNFIESIDSTDLCTYKYADVYIYIIYKQAI